MFSEDIQDWCILDVAYDIRLMEKCNDATGAQKKGQSNREEMGAGK